MDLSERLQVVVSYSQLSVRAFATKCGLKQQTLDKQLKGISEVSSTTLINIATAFSDVSTEWLLRGEGSMLKSQSKEDERMLKLLDTITTLQATINAQSDTINVLTERIKQLEKK